VLELELCEQLRCPVWRQNAVLPQVKYFPPYYAPSFAEPFERKEIKTNSV
jgi:hypothetical protein